ncbi:hypothetical protein ACFUGD_14935 [Streptomyces sp. NPDC057217]|uniref:hypothetical protein n=1 Tax=unclassified Streptomyces TaxID=2593676 RepID=UPI0036405EDF
MERLELAVTTAVITADGGHGGNASPQAVLDGFRPGLAVVAVIALAGLLITLPGLRRPRGAAAAGSVVVARSTDGGPVTGSTVGEDVTAGGPAAGDAPAKVALHD